MRLRPGLELVDETVGDGAPVERQHYYRIRLRMWLNKGEPVRWEAPWGDMSRAELADDGTTMITVVRLDRECLANSLFYGILGMRIGGLRRLRIAPRLTLFARLNEPVWQLMAVVSHVIPWAQAGYAASRISYVAYHEQGCFWKGSPAYLPCHCGFPGALQGTDIVSCSRPGSLPSGRRAGRG